MKEKIAIVLGSKSDLPKIKEGIDLLEGLGVNYSLDIVSAHRNPEKLRKLTLSFKRKSIEAIIAAAGMAAALPGFIASYTDIPVIGVALDGGLLGGLDALFSITGSPKGLGLVASGVGKSAFINAVIFSLEILALGDKKYTLKLKALKSKFK